MVRAGWASLYNFNLRRVWVSQVKTVEGSNEPSFSYQIWTRLGLKKSARAEL